MKIDHYINNRIAAAWMPLLSCLLLLLAVACSEEEVVPPDPQLYTAEGVPYAYVSVGFSMAMNPITKANPTGGEDGDDQEKGQEYENAVNDINLFFYNVEETPTNLKEYGVNLNADTAIVAHKYLTNVDFDYTEATTHAIAVENLLVGQSYHVLAVVNAGENLGTTYATLGDLQSAMVSTLYTKGTDGSYSNFLMSSEGDESTPLVITVTNSENNPASTKIEVERVTARVDYQTEADFDGKIMNGEEEIATASITGAMLVNTLNDQATSYLLKRVTKASEEFSTTDIIYLGDEVYDATTKAANYVKDPLPTKAETNFVSATYFPNIGYGNADNWENLFIVGDKIGDWYRIGYPKENVNATGSKAHSLGVVFRAQVRLADGNEDATTATETDVYPTFFEWGGRYYETLEEVMADFDPQKVIIDGDWSTITTWGAFKNMILGNVQDDPFGYKANLAKEWLGKRDNDSLSDTDKSALSWASYMEETFYYENQEGTVKVDLGDETTSGTTRELLSNKGVHTFKNGVCYYTYWVKHANDGDDDNDMLTGKGGGVMEYATVRNNIYKLSIAGLGRIGDDVPGDAQPMINFSVLRWEPMDNESIDLETNNPTN